MFLIIQNLTNWEVETKWIQLDNEKSIQERKKEGPKEGPNGSLYRH